MMKRTTHRPYPPPNNGQKVGIYEFDDYTLTSEALGGDWLDQGGVDARIEASRKGDFAISFEDQLGQPLPAGALLVRPLVVPLRFCCWPSCVACCSLPVSQYVTGSNTACPPTTATRDPRAGAGCACLHHQQAAHQLSLTNVHAV